MNDSEKLKKLRLLLGLSQDEIAYSMRVSTSTVSRIENNEADLKLKHIRRLSKIYGDQVLSVFELEPTSLDRTWLRQYMQLNNKKKRAVSIVIMALISALALLETA